MIQLLIENWDKVISLSLSIVAIVIALVSSKQTSKLAREQIDEIKRLAQSNAADADRQIEGIKKMTIEATDGVKKQVIGLRELSVKALEYAILSIDDSIQNIYFEKNELKEKYQKELDKIREQLKEFEDKDSSMIKNFYGERVLELDNRIIYLNLKHNRLVDILHSLRSLKSQIGRDYEEAINEAKDHGTVNTVYSELKNGSWGRTSMYYDLMEKMDSHYPNND